MEMTIADVIDRYTILVIKDENELSVKDELEVRRILENPLFWKLLFGLVAAIVVLSIYVSMRRTNMAMPKDPDDYGYQRGWDDSSGDHHELTPKEKLEQVRRGNR